MAEMRDSITVIEQPAGQSVIEQPAGQSASQSASQPVSQSASQPAGQSAVDTAAELRVADTVRVAEPRWGLVLESERLPEPEVHETTTGITGMSWVTVFMLLTVFVAAIRYRSNARFVRTLLQDMSTVRERGNVFDDTVRETSFLVLLNLMWISSAGVLLAMLTGHFTAPAIWVCMGIVGLYTLFMQATYWIVGSVFYDALHAGMWVRGFTAGQGFGAFLLLWPALACICYPGLHEVWLIIGAIVLIIVKIIFICKGFRIFFTQKASWVLFLYYICSLEIVPLILVYVSAEYMCGKLP